MVLTDKVEILEKFSVKMGLPCRKVYHCRCKK